MKQLLDDFNLKIITDFCRLSEQKPKSLLNNKLLKNKIKEHYRFSLKRNELSNEEKSNMGSQSVNWLKDNYEKDDTIIAMFKDGKLIHAFISQNDLFIDAAGTTENIDEIIDDFSVNSPDFRIFNDLNIFLKEFCKNA